MTPGKLTRKRTASKKWLSLPAALLMVISCLIGFSAPSASAAPKDNSGLDHEHAPPGWLPFPADDPFYTPPAGFENTKPGTVLRWRKTDAKAYLIPVPANTYQMLVRTTDTDNKPIAVASTLIVPLTPPLGGQRKLMSYQIAIDSLGSQCNPSYSLRMGLEKDTSGVFLPLFDGWASVMTDYEGENDAWIAGKVAGQATLDGIRAAESLKEGGLNPQTPVGVWGYSGGGHATAWAAQLQGTYAPELNIKGFIAGDFIGDPLKTLAGVNKGPFSGFGFAAAVGLTRAYPELNSILNDKGLAEKQRIGQRCQIELVAMNAFNDINKYTNTDIFNSPLAKKVTDEDSVGKLKPVAPLLIQQSALDEIVRPEYNQEAYKSWCGMGANVEYKLGYVPEHILNDFASIPEMYTWLQGRFAGLPTNSPCTSNNHPG